MIDPFEEVFTLLRTSLSTVTPSKREISTSTEQVHCDECMRQSALNGKINIMMRKDILKHAVLKLDNLKGLRLMHVKQSLSNIERLNEMIQTAEKTCEVTILRVVRHKEALERRLIQQIVNSDRRMRELVFEILGEYGKSNERLSRRQDYLLYLARLQLVSQISYQRWIRFSITLCHELNKNNRIKNESEQNCTELDDYLINSKVLNHSEDTTEWERIKTVLDNNLTNNRSYNLPYTLVAVVKLTRTLQIRRKLSSNSNNVPLSSSSQSTKQTIRNSPFPMKVITNINDLSDSISSVLRPWTLGGKLDIFGSNVSSNYLRNKETHTRYRKPFRDEGKNISTDFIDVSSISWLHPSSFYPMIWRNIAKDMMNSLPTPVTNLNNIYHNEISKLDDFLSVYFSQHSSFVASNRLYYCLEERIASSTLKTIEKDQHSESTLLQLNAIEVPTMLWAYLIAAV